MPQKLLVRRRWIRGRCWFCALFNVCCGFMSEQESTRCMSLSLGGICLGSKYLPLPSMGMINTPSGRLWCLVGKCCHIRKTVGNASFNVIRGSMLRSDSFSLLQASIVTSSYLVLVCGRLLRIYAAGTQQAWQWAILFCFLWAQASCLSGEERRGSRLECVWYSIRQCVKQVGFEKQQRKRGRIRWIAVWSTVTSLCSRETRPWL